MMFFDLGWLGQDYEEFCGSARFGGARPMTRASGAKAGAGAPARRRRVAAKAAPSTPVSAAPAQKPREAQGTREKLGEAFLEDLLSAWKTQGQAAISKVIDSRPQDFFKVVAAMMPKDVTLDVGQVGEMSDAELIERIKALDAAIQPFLTDAAGDGEEGEAAE